MLHYTKQIIVSSLLVLFLMVSTLPALAVGDIEAELNDNKESPDPGTMLIDLIVARPLGLLATLGGSAIFIISSPFSVLGGNAEDAWESLVTNPAEYTFKRPLGEFDE